MYNAPPVFKSDSKRLEVTDASAQYRLSGVKIYGKTIARWSYWLGVICVMIATAWKCGNAFGLWRALPPTPGRHFLLSPGVKPDSRSRAPEPSERKKPPVAEPNPTRLPQAREPQTPEERKHEQERHKKEQQQKRQQQEEQQKPPEQ